MSYPKKIVKVRPLGGIVNDLPAAEVAPEFYTAGRNMHFRSSFAERTIGHAEVYSGTLTTLRNISNCTVAGVNYWVYHGHDNSSVVTGATHNDITIAAGLTATTTSNKWTSGLLNGVHFASNGVDAPMYWDGVPANKMLVLPGFPSSTICGALRAYKFHLFAMDITGPVNTFTDQVLFSNGAEPGTVPTAWTAAATNDAGDTQLSETKGRVIDGATLGSDFIMYKQNSAFVADYAGDTLFIFNFRKLPINHGVLARNCIAQWRDKHFVVTDGDIVLTDGIVSESIADNRMRKFLFNQLDQTNFESTFVVPFTRHNEIWVCFPSAGSTFCDLAMIWDGVANAWGVRDLPDIAHAAEGIVSDTSVSEFWDDDNDAWDTDLTTWNQQNFSNATNSLVLAKSDEGTPTDSQFLQVDAAATFDGTNIDAVISKYSVAFDEPNRVKFVRRVIPHIQADTGTVIKARVGSQMVCTDAIAWSNEVDYTVGTDSHVDTFAQGKYISFEFRSEGLNPWSITGFDVEAELRGYH